TMTGLYSVNLVVMQGSNVALLNQVTLFEATQKILGISNSDLVNVIVSGVVVLIACVLLTAFLHTQLGLALRATGDNEQMIRGLAVNTDHIKWIGLALANGLVALSGALVAQSQGFADAGMGPGSIVTGLAAIILAEG